jgi:FHS family L-fucose permease-like MFS transporter
MVGRLIGSAVMLRVPAGAVLSACAIGAALLTGLSAGTAGWLSAAAIIAVGLFNSVIFPTTFTLAIEGLGRDTPQGSGLICMAIVGGAVIPLIAGLVADHGGLSLALIVPILCYAWIAAYGGLAGSGRIAPPAAA